MWKLLLASVVMLLMLAAGAGAGELERIQARGTLTVSLNRGYPPFSMEKAGNIIGLDVDLAHLLADSLGVKVRFIRPKAYDQQIPKLLAGESDIIMAAMTRTVTRGLKVNFSSPYFEVSQSALARRNKIPAGANAYFDLVAIKDLRLGVKTGTTHERFARQLFPANAITGYPTAAAAAQAVVENKIDAMVADSPFVKIWRNTHIEHYTQITALLTPVTREFYAFAIRKGDQDFLNWLNLFVDQIKTDGTLDLLKYEYFEQMSWVDASMQTGIKTTPSLNRADFLKNRFLYHKQELIQQRREAFQDRGADYE